MAVTYFALVILVQGPYSLRNDAFGDDVAVIRPSTIKRASQIKESDPRDRTVYEKFRDWNVGRVVNSWDYLCISGKCKFNVSYLWTLVLTILSITKEAHLGIVSLKTESEIKIGVFWFWLCSFLSMIVVLIIKVQTQRTIVRGWNLLERFLPGSAGRYKINQISV